MSPIPRGQILRLYKDCMVYLNSLKYSDNGFLKNKVKQEFKKAVADEDEVEHLYNKGQEFLQRKRFV